MNDIAKTLSKGYSTAVLQTDIASPREGTASRGAYATQDETEVPISVRRRTAPCLFEDVAGSSENPLKRGRKNASREIQRAKKKEFENAISIREKAVPENEEEFTLKTNNLLEKQKLLLHEKIERIKQLKKSKREISFTDRSSLGGSAHPEEPLKSEAAIQRPFSGGPRLTNAAS